MARRGRRLARGFGYVLLAIFLFLGVRCWQTSQPAVWTMFEAPSPNHHVIAEVRASSGWGYAKDFVSLRRAGDWERYEPMVIIDDQDDVGLLLRWRSVRELDVGVPGWSKPDVRALDWNGIHLRIVRYPDQPKPHDKAEEIRLFERVATYRADAGPITYKFSRSQSQDGDRYCSLAFATDGGRIARRIGASIRASIDHRNTHQETFVDFMLSLEIRDIQDPNLSQLIVTGAQVIGADYATSMTGVFQAERFDGRPASGNAFDLNLNRLSDVRAVLDLLSHAPYKLAFLWDLPDTVAVYQVNASTTPQDTNAFFDCVGDALPRPDFSFSAPVGR